MGELDEDELRLLAEADEQPNPVITEPVPIADDGEIVEPPPVVAEPELPKVASKGPGRRRRQVAEDEPEPTPEAVPAPEPVVGSPAGPELDNPTAPPAQMDFGDPWGRLPMQMRHYNDGRPAL